MPKFRISQSILYYGSDKPPDKTTLADLEFRDLESAYMDFMKRNSHLPNSDPIYYQENDNTVVSIFVSVVNISNMQVQTYIQIMEVR